ncbi:benzoate/H(+) symporter BenE family transporter [Paenibacillus sp. CC-CFT747]|nr:benzoate/H(+) symporter BenE family transporter [Paenibacillus sp. CC-CFT747]
MHGFFDKVLNQVPKHLIDALLTGLLFSYIAGIIPSGIQYPIPGVLIGFLGLLVEFKFSPIPQSAFIFPTPVLPQFTVKSFFSIAVPLSVLIMSNDLAVALAALKSKGFRPPVNRALLASGFVSMLTGLFGGHSANVGGMMTALCSSDEAGEKEGRFRAALISNGIVIGFGLFSWKVVAIIQLLPSSFVSMIIGFSFVRIVYKGPQVCVF